jgi:hypothetical protein
MTDDGLERVNLVGDKYLIEMQIVGYEAGLETDISWWKKWNIRRKLAECKKELAQIEKRLKEIGE